MAERVADQFQDLERQSEAAHLGIWIFIGSELLFFAGLFALYMAYRLEHPYGFGVGVDEDTIVYGSVNTGVLLLSSFTVATALHELRRGRSRRAMGLVGLTIFLGFAFLCIKTAEYLHHLLQEDLQPGGWGDFYRKHPEPGTKMFYTLYYCMTGLHSVHLLAGMLFLAAVIPAIRAGRIDAKTPHVLELGATYWSFVDMIWIFLWPCFYLVQGAHNAR